MYIVKQKLLVLQKKEVSNGMVTKIKHRFHTTKITERGIERLKRYTHQDIRVFLEDLEGIELQQSFGRYLSYRRTEKDSERDTEIETDRKFLHLVAASCGINPQDTKETLQRKMEDLLVQIRKGVVTNLKIPKCLY